jgi:hypothetical protein
MSPWIDPRTMAVAKRLAWYDRPALDIGSYTEETWWPTLPEAYRNRYVLRARVSIEALIDIGALPEFLEAAE